MTLTRRLRPVLAPTVALVALSAFVAPLRAAPVAASKTSTASTVKSLTLQSQTPWVGAGGTFEIRIAAPPAQTVAPTDLEYAISVHPSSPTRNAFAATLTSRPTTPTL